MFNLVLFIMRHETDKSKLWNNFWQPAWMGAAGTGYKTAAPFWPRSICQAEGLRMKAWRLNGAQAWRSGTVSPQILHLHPHNLLSWENGPKTRDTWEIIHSDSKTPVSPCPCQTVTATQSKLYFPDAHPLDCSFWTWILPTLWATCHHPPQIPFPTKLLSVSTTCNHRPLNEW